MYKVFVNNKPIVITQGAYEPQKVNYKTSLLSSVSKASVKKVVEQLYKTSDYTEVIIQTDNAEKTWKEFCALFTVINAAGGIVENTKGEILFIKRNGLWDLPKGKIEVGEEIKAAALREVEEECGISNLELNEPLANTYHIYYLKDQYCIKNTYWFKMKYTGTELLVPQLSEGITEAKWMNKNEINYTVLTNTYANIFNIMQDYLAFNR